MRQGHIRTGWTWLLLVLLACAAPPLHASGVDPWTPFVSPWFERVNTSDGLPHSVTTALAQDARGVVWIGTMGGLVRYDGFRMQVFDAGHAPDALRDAYVRSLLALPDGDLLVGTNAGGLARFETVNGRFLNYPVGRGGLSDPKIYDLADDGRGGAWVATDRGIDHLDVATGRIAPVPLGNEAAPRNFSVLQDAAGDLFLGNDRGLFVRRTGTRGFTRVDVGDPVVSAILRNQVWALQEDRQGRLWVGSGQRGVAYRDPDGRWFAVPGFSPSAQRKNFPTVRHFAQAATGDEWIATDGEGVLVYRPGESSFRRLAHDPAVSSSLQGDSIRDLLFDHAGNMWAATDLGAAHTNTQAELVCSMLPSPLARFGLSESNVQGILVDSRRRVWLGLGNGRIDLVDLQRQRLLHLALDGAQGHRDVLAFDETPDGTIWAGSLGLARINPDTLKVTSNVLPQLSGQPILSLADVGGFLLMGTYDGVYRYDLASGRLDHFRHDPGDPGSLASDTVRYIATVDGKVWYATTAGISVADRASDDRGFRQIRQQPGQAASLPNDYVGSIAADTRGNLWFATFGGVAELPAGPLGATPRFRVFDTGSGLSSDKVNAVRPDGRGHVWASLSNGIAVIDGTSGEIRNLGARDGLHISSYIYLATARAPDGSMLFGGQGGLTLVRARSAHEEPARVPPPAVTLARVGGRELPPGQLPRSGDSLTMADGRRGMQLSFALLDYRAPLETHYSYRMEGFDDGWTEIPVGSPPTAVYTNLPHGKYTLRLRASTRGLFPTTVETDLGVVVQPRWYETTWLRILAAIAGMVAVFLLVHLRTLYLRRQAKRLQRQVDERTRDLQEANARLDKLAGTDELTGVYNRRRFLALAEGVRALSAEGQACLAVLDLDRFKQINDSHGHLAGDAVIRAMTDVIVSQCRPGDLVGRYGGEELVICLADCPADEAMRVAERIRRALAATAVAHAGHTIRVTTSIGVAAIHRQQSLEQWLARADAALYEAKHQGRNCVVLASE
ncbi:MAG: diguanylate cyclase [Xanthomonadaceae bacterium]|nr:diguanylate cyclase [Xanthomonadaceae bacterium]MDE1963638.1 diguanylate cyclase [Xanthomonadaceae bacterium]